MQGRRLEEKWNIQAVKHTHTQRDTYIYIYREREKWGERKQRKDEMTHTS